jgi:predicted DNA-binding protein (MmcQ/YjbR family)
VSREDSVAEGDEVPIAILSRLRSICLALPDAYEEQAWVGTRWRVRKRTFVHVLPVEEHWPPAYVRAAEPDGPQVVLTFHASGQELHALRNGGPPFFPVPWSQQMAGMTFGADVDWDEVAELLTESYCLLAPKKLTARVERPA